MRILHVQLCGPYTDGWSYQENVLPRMHKNQGYDVEIVTTVESYENGKLVSLSSGVSSTKEGIPLIRIPYSRMMPLKVARKLRTFVGLDSVLSSFEPQIIFLHESQFLDVKYVVEYAKKNSGTRIFVDCHTDFVNSAKNWISKNVLHKIIYKGCAKKIEPFTTKFFGTLPARSDFLREVYNIPAEKIELLPFGAEDDKIDWEGRVRIRRDIREQMKLAEDDFVIISGGKLDKRKNIHLLMEAVREIDNDRVKLIIFGSSNAEMKAEIEELSRHERIRHTGWLDSDQVYNYFLASDLAVFPGTHSVLWEQAIGTGLPAIFRKWKGFDHVDLGGNCLFLETDTAKEIRENVCKVVADSKLFQHMKQTAILKGIPNFAYSEIAKKAIGE